MSFNQLPRHLFTEGEKRRGEERVSVDKQFLRLVGSLDLILNTGKVIFVTSKVYVEENSQTRIFLLIFIRLCLRVVALIFSP